jgi:iron(III) transport system permease protein
MPATLSLRSRVPLTPEAVLRSFQRQLPGLALVLLVGLLVLLPVIPLQEMALRNFGEGLRQLAANSGTEAIFTETALLGVGAVLVALLAGTILAFSVDALPRRIQRAVGFVPVIPLIIPSVAHVAGFVFLFSPENGYVNSFLRSLPPLKDLASGPLNIYTPTGIIVYTGVHLSAFVYLFIHTGLNNLGKDYAQAARVSGAGWLRITATITLPMLRPVFVYATLVVLLLALGQFSGPLMLGRREGLDVITTEMYQLTHEFPVNYPLGAAFATPLILVAILLVWLQRRIIGDQDRFVGRGVASTATEPGSVAQTTIALTVIVVYIGISAILPLLALTFVALSPFWSGDISFATLTLRHVTYVLENPVVMDAVKTTLVLSLAAVAMVIPLGMLIALALYYKNLIWRPIAVALDVLANLPLALPAALVGFGFLFAYSSLPIKLYGSQIGLALAFVTVMIPFSVRYQLATLIAVGKSTTEASRANGGGPLRTFFQVILPLARSGIAAAAAVIFVLLIHEFGVALMLRSNETNVMSVVLFELYSAGGLYPRVAAMALLMTLITSVGVAIAVWVGGAKAFERL